jgi:hypothetical protein
MRTGWHGEIVTRRVRRRSWWYDDGCSMSNCEVDGLTSSRPLLRLDRLWVRYCNERSVGLIIRKDLLSACLRVCVFACS